MNPRRRAMEQTSVLFTKGPWSLSDSTVHTVFVHWLLLFGYYFTTSTKWPSGVWSAHASSPHHKWSLSSEYFSRRRGEEARWCSSPGCWDQHPPEPAGLLWVGNQQRYVQMMLVPPEIWATSCCRWLFKVLLEGWAGEDSFPLDAAVSFVMPSPTGLIEWELWNLSGRTQRARKCESQSNGTLNGLFVTPLFCIVKEVGVPSK